METKAGGYRFPNLPSVYLHNASRIEAAGVLSVIHKNFASTLS